jgi:hypothetical protein
MNELKIEANISEVNGPYYRVKLHVVPHVGELIKLYSFTEQAANKPPVKHYRVVQVRHDIHDMCEKIPQSQDGSHFVEVFVTPEDSQLFDDSSTPTLVERN